jgi:hypothetical protein
MSPLRDNKHRKFREQDFRSFEPLLDSGENKTLGIPLRVDGGDADAWGLVFFAFACKWR